jgi:hypothetical protein
MFDIDRYGIGRVMDECVAHMKDYDGIHLSYDIDALDPFFAPHTGDNGDNDDDDDFLFIYLLLYLFIYLFILKQTD